MSAKTDEHTCVAAPRNPANSIRRRDAQIVRELEPTVGAVGSLEALNDLSELPDPVIPLQAFEVNDRCPDAWSYRCVLPALANGGQLRCPAVSHGIPACCPLHGILEGGIRCE